MFGDPLDKQFSQSLLDAARKINDKTVADAKTAKEEKDRLDAEDNSMIGQFDEARPQSLSNPNFLDKDKEHFRKLTRHVKDVEVGAMRAKAKKQLNPMTADEPVKLTNETEIDADLFTAEELTRLDEIIGRGLTGVFFNPASQLAAMAQYGTGTHGHGSLRSSGNSSAPANNPAEVRVRSTAIANYNKSSHKSVFGFKGAYSDRHGYGTNSQRTRTNSAAVDALHASVKAQFPAEHAINPERATAAFFKRNPAQGGMEDQVNDYHKNHYLPALRKERGQQTESLTLASAAMIAGSVAAGAAIGNTVNAIRDKFSKTRLNKHDRNMDRHFEMGAAAAKAGKSSNPPPNVDPRYYDPYRMGHSFETQKRNRNNSKR